MFKIKGLSLGNPSLRKLHLLAVVLVISASIIPATASDKDIVRTVDDGIRDILSDLELLLEAVSPTGTPSAPTGTPSAPTGTPSAPTGTPSEPTGTPSEPTGTPSEPTGTPSEPSGTPSTYTDSSTLSTDSSSNSTYSSTLSTDSSSNSTDSSTANTTMATAAPSARLAVRSPLVKSAKQSHMEKSSSTRSLKSLVVATNIEVCTIPVNNCNDLNSALTEADAIAQELAQNIIEDRQQDRINDARDTVHNVCADQSFQNAFTDIDNLELAIEVMEENKRISAATLTTVEGKETATIAVSVVGSLLVLAVIGLSIGLAVIFNKYSEVKAQQNTQGEIVQTQEQESNNDYSLGMTNAALMINETSPYDPKTSGSTPNDQLTEHHGPGPYDLSRPQPGPSAMSVRPSAPYERDLSSPPKQDYGDRRYQDGKSPMAGSQGQKPSRYDDAKFENTQMRFLGGSYPPANRDNPPSRNDSRGPYGEPRPRNPYISPTRKPTYEDRARPRPSSSYYPPSSKYQDRPGPGSSRYNDRPSGYPDRSSRPPPQRSASYRPGPSSGAGSKAPPKSRSDIRGPYGPEDLY